MATERDAGTSPEEDRRSGDRIFAPPPGSAIMPAFDSGWRSGSSAPQPFLSYADGDPSVNWSDQLEALHEEASRNHFMDRWTRTAVIERLGVLAPHAKIADIGCSTGYLLEDVLAAYPDSEAVGIDLIAAGLRKTHQRLPEVRLLQADARKLPIVDQSIDAIVSANLLEHVPDDVRALKEFQRILRPGGRAVIVVPAGPRTYDYYDRFLGHERRYARGELASKCSLADFEVVEDVHLAALLYPAFWLVKQRNRRRYGSLRGSALEDRVSTDIRRTRNSRVGELAWRVEDRLAGAGLRLPFGIRSLVVARRRDGRG